MPVCDQAQDFVHHRRTDQGGVPGLIVGRGDLDDVTPNQVEAPEPAQQPLRLERSDASDLRGTRARRVHRIETVHVEGNIGRAVPDHSARLRDYSVDADLGDVPLTHRYDLERQNGDIEAFYRKIKAAGI